MRKNKLLLLLALLLTAVTGAWAQTPLLTIEGIDNEDFTSGSKTFDDKVTVTFSNPVYNDGDEDGWYSAGGASLLTVAGTNGYTITSCKFYTSEGTAATGYTIVGESPSVYLYQGHLYTDDSKSVTLGTYGVAKIEVFGAATAASTYTVSMKDGVKDADKWTITPNPAEEGQTVTLQYNGRLKVKGVKATSEAGAPAAPIEVLTYSFDDANSPSGLTAGSRVSFDYSRTSVISNSKFLNAYNSSNGDPNATTVSLGDTDLSGETWTLSFEWAACGGCNSKPDHTTLKAGDATLFDLSGNSNWNTTVTIIYTGSDGSKTLPVPACDKSNRWTAAVGDQYNTTTYWHHIVVTGSAEGVKMTITNSSTGAAVVEDVVLSETNVNPTSLIIEPCCGGGIGIDALSLTYEE